MQQQQSSRGGRRPGSGRPANNRSVALMVRITPEADAILKQQPNKSEFIDRIIKEHHGQEEKAEDALGLRP